jgi:aerobic-type carbon monoxide dehydrogenase small subunit (CoxS/CutS family)
MATQFRINVDGTDHQIEAEPDMPLLYALTNELGKKGPKFGCGLAQCGACTVIHDGTAIRSCSVPVSAITGKVRTLDGIGTPDKPHPIQTAFIEAEAGQCEYCINGWIMTSLAFLEKNPRRTDEEIRGALAGLKCRCGTQVSILRAVRRAADEMAG